MFLSKLRRVKPNSQAPQMLREGQTIQQTKPPLILRGPLGFELRVIDINSDGTGVATIANIHVNTGAVEVPNIHPERLSRARTYDIITDDNVWESFNDRFTQCTDVQENSILGPND
ncbi:uncharacterized protein PADG_11621 [Paracoccidioides brasiliensis Pb18]|uniref:Uncharacterized protein n=1 Tax=Paracoccidioides brasiliensis (strain Pb18) TaxID=502780 RepID=A0A0A0HVM3_PARBD|nr:uncharacterized protein PADG_11621 [Paracoccidioides brasiliensis Pb18]KGM92091.1 hypothetical protein PADG_11621 [Paracoccidioides brasiliensis Pb18]ODH49574.1 hypothetical protein GX48_04361 [Paracoccidioides brasiliensis]